MFEKKCPVCKKKIIQKEVWHAKKSKFIKEWLCLNCMQDTRIQRTSSTLTSGRESKSSGSVDQSTTMAAHKTLELQDQTVYLEITVQYPNGKSSTSRYNKDDERISSEEGYLLAIKLEIRDESLMREITNVIEKYGFNTPLVDYENHKSFKRSQNVSGIEANLTFEEICYYLEKKFPKKPTAVYKDPMHVQDTEPPKVEPEYSTESRFTEKALIDETIDDKALEIKDEEQYENTDDIEIPIPYISEDLETTITINYGQRMKAKSRIFVSKKQSTKPNSTPLEQDRAQFKSEQIKGKDVTGYVGENWVRFKMGIKKFRTSHARWVYGGNKEIGTDDSPGYTLMVTFANNEKVFKNLVIQSLQKNGFGCLVGNTSASCHRIEEYPTDEKARQVLKDICQSVNSKIYL